jgi:hypothetical protein
MSQETERELEAKIEKAKEDLAQMEFVLDVIRSKPKLKHGDFNHYDECGLAFVAIRDHVNRLVKSRCTGVMDCKIENIHNTGCTADGNIYELMKEAGKDGVIIALSRPAADYYAESYGWVKPECTEVHNKVKAALARKAL